MKRILRWLPVALFAACSPANQPTPVCGEDGGPAGPTAATAAFSAYLQTLPGCNVTDGCVLVQTACSQSFEDCDFTETAVPAQLELQVQDKTSAITAEDCPASCQIEAFEAPFFPPNVSPNDGCQVTQSPTAVCVLNPIPDAGTCMITEAPEAADGGIGNYQRFCGFNCPTDEFCDISGIETACSPDLPGIFLVSPNATGTCAPIFTSNGSCSVDQDCSFGSACVDPTTNGPCISTACQQGGGICQQACPDVEPTCPEAVTPADDGRHCVVCVTDVCVDAGF